MQRDNELLENQALDVEKAAQLRSEKEQKEKLICDMDLKIQDMRSHIVDLETKLAEKTREAESLRGETTSTKLLEEARKYISDLEKKIQCLQQTVFKECQERSDLLYTLSSLKAQNAELSARRGSSITPALPPLGSTGSVQPGQPSQSQRSQRGSMFQRQSVSYSPASIIWAVLSKFIIRSFSVPGALDSIEIWYIDSRRAISAFSAPIVVLAI